MLHTDASLAFVLKKRSKFTLFVTNMYSLQDLASHAVVFRGVILPSSWGGGQYDFPKNDCVGGYPRLWLHKSSN